MESYQSKEILGILGISDDFPNILEVLVLCSEVILSIMNTIQCILSRYTIVFPQSRETAHNLEALCSKVTI